MATITAISITEYEAALVALNNAIESASWSTAWKAYAQAESILSGLVLQAADPDSMIRRRDDLRAIADALKAAQIFQAGGSRFIRAKTGFTR